jgi:hypothetical protein
LGAFFVPAAFAPPFLLAETAVDVQHGSSCLTPTPLEKTVKLAPIWFILAVSQPLLIGNRQQIDRDSMPFRSELTYN